MAAKGSLQITLPTTGFKRSMLFNRFAVEREDGFVLIHFGLVSKQNAQVDSYSAAISELELLNQKKTTMDYLGRQGTLGEEPPSWQPPTEKKIELVNHIVMAHHGPIAETAFFGFSFWSAMMESRKNKSDAVMTAEPIAVLRSPLVVQQHLIRLLFQSGEALLPQQ